MNKQSTPQIAPALMQLTEELIDISLMETGTMKPFFMLASLVPQKNKEAFQIPVDFSNKQQLEFTSVKIAAILQHKNCDHYCFATRIQFKATAGGKEAMKQQVLVLFAEKEFDNQSDCHESSCFAKLYNLKLNQELARPQLVEAETLDDYDGQFSNLFDAPRVPDDLMSQLTENINQYRHTK